MTRLAFLAAAAATLLAACASEDAAPTPAPFHPSATVGGRAALATTPLASAREYHSATLLPSGDVLVAGGMNSAYLTSAERYNAATMRWTATGSMGTARQQHVAVLLQSGKVLVAAGFGVNGRLASCELYDPAKGTWSATGSLTDARYHHTATLLPDGKVLVVGGLDASAMQNPLASAELYDPATGTWSPTGSLQAARSSHTATLLPSGKVLVAGGNGTEVLASAEVYDPGTGTWSVVGSMGTARYLARATLLPTGKVLVAAGLGSAGALGSAELYDPATGAWSSTGSLGSARYNFGLDTLGGLVIAIAGVGGGTLASAEAYDPATGTWTDVGAIGTARYAHTVTHLPNGPLLVVGGWGSLGYLASVELFTTPNAQPVASAATTSTPEDTPVTVTLSGTDADGDPLTYAIVTPPQHGTVVLDGADATYTPAANHQGSDSFVFTVNDGIATSAPSTVGITITPVNDPPVAGSVTLSTAEDAPAGFTVASDVDGDALTCTLITPPGHGAVTFAGCVATYTPTADFSGTDAFSFKANDGTVDSSVATVTLDVTPVNDPPVAQARSSATAEDTPVEITLAGADVEGDALTYAIVGQPGHGTVTLAGDKATYTPAANFYGTDSFTFRARDGVADSNVATVTLTVTPVNDAPFAVNGFVSLPEDGSGAIPLTAEDVEGDALTFTIVTPPAHGLLAGTGGNSWTYAPEADFNGSDSFTFTANDGAAGSNTATVTITVSPVNDAPTAMPATASVVENSSVAIPLGATDVDADTLAYALVTQPAHGTVTLAGQTATYTPGPDFTGTDAFTYKASDGVVDSNDATVTVTVVNDPANDPKSGGGCSSATTGSVSPLAALLLGLLALRRRPQ